MKTVPLENNIQRVLLIRRKALGDCLVTLPAVRQLVKAFPGAQFDLVIDGHFAALISLLMPGVKVIPWVQAKNDSWAEARWYSHLRRQQYQVVIDWLGNPRTALWTAATGAPVRVGYDLPRRRWAYNIKVQQNQLGNVRLRGFAGEAFLDPLRALGLNPEPWSPLPAEAGALEIPAQNFGSDYCRWRDQWFGTEGAGTAIMMSATWPAKAWPNHNIIDLWRKLGGQGRRPLIIPGPGDEAMEKVLREDLPSGAFAPPTSLIELADLLGHCAAFVGTDCGGRHLAMALGLPTATLFGPTDSEGWNPNHPRHVAIKMDLDCLGCNLKTCPLPGRPCLEQLSPSMVAEGLSSILNN